MNKESNVSFTPRPRNTLIDMTKRRKSRAVGYCPVCGRKGMIQKEQYGTRVNRTHYMHKAHQKGAVKHWFEQCIVDEITGEEIEIKTQTEIF